MLLINIFEFVLLQKITMNFLIKFWSKIENKRILKHFLFWLGYTLLNVSVGLTNKNESVSETLVFGTLILIPQLLSSYFFAYFIIPELFFKKKYVLFILTFFVSVYLFSAIARTLVVHVGEPLFRIGPFEQESINEIFSDLRKLWEQYIPMVFSVSFMFLFVKYFLELKQKNEEAIQLAKEKSETELKALKAQLNPHFLFNTLNNIYSLSIDSSPKTPIAIGKLASILDHVLYKCNNEKVSLHSEIELIQNYIELEKLRYDDRLQVNLKTQIETDFEVPPLVLLSLVENAFKHGAGEDSGSPTIFIEVINEKNNFKFEVINSVSKDYIINSKENIGLSNIRKQLDLIYGKNYSLDIIQKSLTFCVCLKINQN
jgi:sensor histidine kinase YesM